MNGLIRGLIKALLMLGFLAFLVWLNFCLGVSTTYCAASDPATDWGTATDQFTTDDLLALFVPEHRVRDGKLYLKVQVTRPWVLLGTSVTFGDWDVWKVRRFRQEHPELEPYWPDRGRADGGVQWLARSGRGRGP